MIIHGVGRYSVRKMQRGMRGKKSLHSSSSKIKEELMWTIRITQRVAIVGDL